MRMDFSTKRVVYINLASHTSEVKSIPGLNKYIGGVSLGLRLLANDIEKDPVVFSIGPLNGFFPYVSKTSIVMHHQGVIEDIYLGGSLSLRIKFMGIDAIVINGASKTPVILEITDGDVAFKSMDVPIDTLGLPGKRSVITFAGEKISHDSFFTTPETFLETKLTEKNITGIVVTGSKTFSIKTAFKYEQLFNALLKQEDDMEVQKSDNPSCSGCPMGCKKSQVGEIGGNVLIHSLVACTFAQKIYSDVGIVFSCLNTLGYDYTHEDIENLPKLVEEIIKELS